MIHLGWGVQTSSIWYILSQIDGELLTWKESMNKWQENIHLKTLLFFDWYFCAGKVAWRGCTDKLSNMFCLTESNEILVTCWDRWRKMQKHYLEILIEAILFSLLYSAWLSTCSWLVTHNDSLLSAGEYVISLFYTYHTFQILENTYLVKNISSTIPLVLCLGSILRSKTYLFILWPSCCKQSWFQCMLKYSKFHIMVRFR